MGDRGPVAVASHERGHRREVAARRVARDRDPVGIAAQLGGVLGDPLDRGVTVRRRGGEGVLRREAVVDGDDQAVGAIGESGTDVVVAIEVAQCPPPAVEEHTDREGSLAVGFVDPDGDRRFGARKREVPDVGDRLGFFAGEKEVERTAGAVDRQAVGRRHAVRVQHVEYSLDLWMGFARHTRGSPAGNLGSESLLRFGFS